MSGARWRRRGALYALVALATTLVLFVALPIAVILLATTPAALAETAVDPQVVASVRVTFAAAALATALGLLTGVPLAYLLARRRFVGQRAVEALLGLPIVIPHTSAGVALLLTYGARGPLGEPLSRLGLLFTDRLGGITVAMLFVGVPFLVVAAREAIAGINPELEQAALVDGASPWQMLTRVTLPLARRGIASGALLMWARGISEFGAVVLLAYHPRTLAVLIFERFQGFGLDAATPLAALLVILAVLIFVLSDVVVRGDGPAL
jgi:molybdate/tungstate transport system permease protein